MPSTTTTQVVNTAIIDAEATASAYAGMAASCMVCQGNIYWAAGTIAAAAVIGADASGAFGGRYSVPNNSGKTTNINLVDYLLVTNNDTEQFGVKHNTALNFINKKPNKQEFLDNLLRYEINSWIEILSIVDPSLSVSQKNDIVLKAREGQIIETLKTKNIFNSTSEVNFEYYLGVSSYSSETKNELREIINTYKNLFESKTSSVDELTFLNNEISKRLKIETAYTTEETTVLIFLSVLKHSTFYWNS